MPEVLKIRKIQYSKDSILIRNETDYLISEVDGEAVMMNTFNGSYWGLNATSTDIWNFLSEQRKISEILDMLIEKYDVEEEVCRTETFPIINKLLKLKIVKLLTQEE